MAIKFEITNRFTGETQFVAEIDCAEDARRGVKIGLAVKWAIENKANLRGANLRGADLRGANLWGADLRGADLWGADLRGANLRGADLRGANLWGADLRDADLRDADLWGADLRGADLRDADLWGADLRSFKSDFWMILTMAHHEVPFLVEALTEGRVNGSTYEGECACLVGTLEKAPNAECDLPRDSASPAEQWFAMIEPGDTPDKDTGGGFAAKMALEWIAEWQSFHAAEEPAQ